MSFLGGGEYPKVMKFTISTDSGCPQPARTILINLAPETFFKCGSHFLISRKGDALIRETRPSWGIYKTTKIEAPEEAPIERACLVLYSLRIVREEDHAEASGVVDKGGAHQLKLHLN